MQNGNSVGDGDIICVSAPGKEAATVNRVELLYRLQKVDTEIDAAHHRLRQIETSLGETETLRRTRAALQEAEKAHRKWQAKLQDLELQMEALNAKIENNQRRLYSGKVKNPKELGNLQEELNYLRRRKSNEEDRLLEAMINVEEREAALHEAQTRWQTEEAAWKTEQADLAAQKETLNARLEALAAERNAREKEISDQDLRVYEELRQQKSGKAVTLLQKNLCQSCYVEAPSSRTQQARQGELVFCGSCGRILHAGS
jgi:hypothetical protein